MRLDKLLANMGFGSRKDVKKIIKSGQVQIEGTIIKDSSTHIDPNEQVIAVNNEQIFYREHIYLMINKPAGYLSATTDDRHPTVLELLTEEYLVFNPYPVGRLDLDTEGLLILSNDGEFAHHVTSPKKDVYKTYFARIDGVVDRADQALFEKGMSILDGVNKPYTTKPARLSIITSGSISEVEVSISEGKFHQIKRMFSHVGKQVIYLKRMQIGNLKLDSTLALGDYKELTENELNQLFIKGVN